MVGGRTFAGLLASLSLILSAPAAAQNGHKRFAVEDLLAMEAFAGARVDRSGRWVVWERRGRSDGAATYAYGALTTDLLTDLVVVDASGRRPDRVIGAEDTAGYRAGPISPDGRRMMVHRLTAEGRTLGILTFETGEIVWTDLSVDLPILGRTAAWRNDREIVALLTPEGRQPLYYRLGWEVQARTSDAWAQALEGRESTALQVWSGRNRDRRPQRTPGVLAVLDVETGAVRRLAEGEMFDLEVSPDGTRAAVLENGGEVQTDGGRLAIGDPTRRRRLRLVDLDDGRIVEALSDLDLMSHLLTWSPDGSELLVFARSPGGDWADGGFHRVGWDGESRVVALAGARPAVLRIGGERIPIVRGGWVAGRPVVLIEDADGPVWLDPETGERRVRDRFGRLVQDGEGTLFDGADGLGYWDGPLAEGLRLAEDGATRDGGSRASWNPTGATASTAVDASGCLRMEGLEEAFCPEGPGRRVAAAGATAVFVETRDDGTTLLRLERPEGGRDLARFNPDLAEVAWGEIQEVAHAGIDGRPLKSWLLVPPGDPPATGWPLVVTIYPGRTHETAPPALRPGSEGGYVNAHVLAAAGYAVLVASLPLEDDVDGALPDLAARIDLVVDAALALGGLDGDRLALLGHSYGGRGVLVTGTQTGRYRALIASAGAADYGSGLHDTLHAQASPEDGILINAVSGWFESGQGRMRSLPWDDPAAWTRASPLYRADRIRTPVLLIHGDLDPQGYEAMFAALYRLHREASLITYRGEGHNLVGPANVVDLHERVLAWLEERLAPRGEAETPAPQPKFQHETDEDRVVGPVGDEVGRVEVGAESLGVDQSG